MKLAKKEIQELAELDALCFKPPINYSFRDIVFYTKPDHALLIRRYSGKKLIAFCLGSIKDGSIVTIDVHPDFRRRGLGRLLLEEIIEEFKKRGVRRAVSQIALDNLPSLKLHKELGFVITHILYGYYPDGSAAYELVLDLGAPSSPKK